MDQHEASVSSRLSPHAGAFTPERSTNGSQMQPCPICSQGFADTEALIRHVDVCLGSPAPKPALNPALENWVETTDQTLGQILAGSCTEGQLAQLERVFSEQLHEVRMIQVEKEQTPIAHSPGTRLREDEEFARQLAAEFDAVTVQEKQLRESEEQEAFEALLAAELSCCACEKLQDSEQDIRALAAGCEHRVCRSCVTGTIMQHLDCGGTGPIQCPVPSCTTALAQADARAHTSDELFERYTAFTLDCAIKESEGFVKCPKCNTVVELLAAHEQSAAEQQDNLMNSMATGRGLDGARVSKEAQLHAEEHRFRCRTCDTIFCSSCGQVPYHIGFSCEQFTQWNTALKCVYCQGVWQNGTSHHPLNHKQNMGQLRASMKKHHAIDCHLWDMSKPALLEHAEHIMQHVCDEPECRENASIGCLKPLECGHMCGGVLGEERCMDCLHRDCVGEHSEGSTRDDFCNVCWVSDLGSAPCTMLECGHIFHAQCVRGQLEKGYSGARISFGHLGCPLCKAPMAHAWLEPLLRPGLELYEAVKDKASKRLEFEKLADDPQIKANFDGDSVKFALKKFAYYMCFKCNEPYFGGHRNCEDVEEDREFDPTELVCLSLIHI
eukprot:TRINITY_DN8096_c0_g1_i4.p1 TRINITY_DN8096_c0_g1~~TRINITY_DN8096_c0_g1_i4.p1  ORF type:complete len:610 (-),score=158.24 TRINITY_DN8096_c0_g1_i4:132-1961(-)